MIQVPWAEWWQVIVDSHFEGVDGLFVHPVQDELVMAGNGTIGLEIVDDLPDVDTVLVPYGGGGLATGIASAVKQLRPKAKVYAVDPDIGPSASAAFAAGKPVVVEHTKSFVDGAGGIGVLDAMWPYVSEALDGAYVVSVAETVGGAENARRADDGGRRGRRRTRAGGGAGRPRRGQDGRCIVSGGNIDAAVLSRILAGEVPA